MPQLIVIMFYVNISQAYTTHCAICAKSPVDKFEWNFWILQIHKQMNFTSYRVVPAYTECEISQNVIFMDHYSYEEVISLRKLI